MESYKEIISMYEDEFRLKLYSDISRMEEGLFLEEFGNFERILNDLLLKHITLIQTVKRSITKARSIFIVKKKN